MIIVICIFLVVLAGYLKNKRHSKIFGNMIALLSPGELILYLTIISQSLDLKEYFIGGITSIAFCFLIICNISFFLYIKRTMQADQTYVMWEKTYRTSSKIILVVGILLNFRVVKLIYSGLFGMDYF
jgi:threonine/homoserine/homoserine lactone efflux protein